MNDVTVIVTQKLDDKDKQVGIFFDRNRLTTLYAWNTACASPVVYKNVRPARLLHPTKGRQFFGLFRCTSPPTRRCARWNHKYCWKICLPRMMLVIRLYRKCSGRLYRSTGCGSPRWISDNDYYRKSSGVDHIRLIRKARRNISDKVYYISRYYQRLFGCKFKIPPLKV